MKRQVVVMISIALVSFLVGTLFSMGSTALGILPNPFGNDLSELQEKIDSLNATLIELKKKMQIEIVRFTEPNEINITNHNGMTLLSGGGDTVSFVWNPRNPSNNTILSVLCSFEFRCDKWTWAGTEMGFITDIYIKGNFHSSEYGIHLDKDSAEVAYDWTQVCLQVNEGEVTQVEEPYVFPSWIRPNQESYNLTLRTWSRFSEYFYVPTYIRNINIIMEVIDG